MLRLWARRAGPRPGRFVPVHCRWTKASRSPSFWYEPSHAAQSAAVAVLLSSPLSFRPVPGLTNGHEVAGARRKQRSVSLGADSAMLPGMEYCPELHLRVAGAVLKGPSICGTGTSKSNIAMISIVQQVFGAGLQVGC